MNSSGWLRGMLAKHKKYDEYMEFVFKMIKKQIAQWDCGYVVKLWEEKRINPVYKLTITDEKNNYIVTLSESEIVELQHKSPYSLDRTIWESLIEQGFTLEQSDGNYLKNCFL